MKEVAQEMQITCPSTTDIDCVLRELDQNSDGEVSKIEFEKLIELVLIKMYESEAS